MAPGEFRPLPPVRPGNGIGTSVVIQVAKDRTFAPIIFIEVHLGERMENMVSTQSWQREGAETGDKKSYRLHYDSFVTVELGSQQD